MIWLEPIRVVAPLTLLSIFLLVSSASALTYTGSADKIFYALGETINYTGASSEALNTTVNLSLASSSGTILNSRNVSMNGLNFSTTMNASVSSSGDYLMNASFVFNNSTFVSAQLIKIYKSSKFTITTIKPTYSPGETINFTVKATDLDGNDVPNENVSVKIIYLNNDTNLTATKNGLTDSKGEYSSTFTAPSATDFYRLVVNGWATIKVIEVGSFEIVSFPGDANGNSKFKFAVGETAYLFLDLFTLNKTKYTNSESISFNITYPNATSTIATQTYSGNRTNTSFVASINGTYTIRISVVSVSKTVEFTFDASTYDLRAQTFSPLRGFTNIFFPNDTVNLVVKVYNVSSGQTLTNNFTAGTWQVSLLDSDLNLLQSISNSTSMNSLYQYRFNFSAPSSVGVYFLKAALNQSEIIIDLIVQDVSAEAIPVDQDYNFKDFFISGKHTVRVITTLGNYSGSINVTNVTVSQVLNSSGYDITSSLSFNTSTIAYKGARAGLIEFAAPPDADWYVIKTLSNSKYSASAWFLVKTYSVCANLAGYKWFVSGSSDVSLNVRVTTVQDIGFIEGLGGISGKHGGEAEGVGEGNTSFGTMYGMGYCGGGNASSSVQVEVTKVFNTLTLEDYTLKLSSLPSGTTDSTGNVVLNITKPSSGWDTGWYGVEFKMKDQTNKTDRGFGGFNVKNLWINVWPKQVGGFWRWYFGPTENFTFDIFAYNSSSDWYWYGTGQGVGDNCYLNGIFYSGDGSEWFWPPKELSSSTYTSTCTGSSGRFNLTITPSSAFKSGYYTVRVKVNTTSGLGDVGEGSIAIKVYNVWVKSSSSNWYDSWYKTTNEQLNFTVDVTYANDTSWSCGWSTCNSKIGDNINISVKSLQKYENYKPQAYSTTRYNATLSNYTGSGGGGSVALTQNVFNVSNISLTSVNITLANNSFNTSVAITIPKNATNNITSATMTVKGYQVNNTFPTSLAVVLQGSNMFNTSNLSSSNVTSFVTALNNGISGCAANAGGNCTAVFNVSSSTAGIVELSNLTINYNLTAQNTSTSGSNLWWTNTTSGGAIVTLNPNGTWQSGYYQLVVEVFGPSGSETSTNWFEVRPFFVDVVPVNQNGTNTWAYSSGDTIRLNISAANKPSWMRYSVYSNTSFTYSNATIKSMKLQYYNPTNWQMTNVSISSYSPISISGITMVNLTTESLSSGSYNFEVTLNDSTGNEATGYGWFEVRNFRLSAQTNNWKWIFLPNETISIRAAACSATTWWCDPTSNTYSGKTVNITVSKLARTNTWPYTNVSGWTATSGQITNSSGTSTLNITPTSRLSSGYYMAELTGRYVDGSGSSETATVWFSIQSFSFTAYATKGEFAANENLTVGITADQQINITDIQISCGQWPNYKSYRLNDNLRVNQSSVSAGTRGLSINVTSGSWGAGWCSGQITASDPADSSSTQTQWLSFNVKTFTLEVQPVRYVIVKNETPSLRIISDRTLILSDLNLTRWDYVGGTSQQTFYKLNTNLTANTSSVAANSHIRFNISSNWTNGYHSGQITLSDPSDSSLSSSAYFYFQVYDIVYGYGYSSTWPLYINTTTIPLDVYAFRYNSSSTNIWWPFDGAANINITVLEIKRENCASWPCTYTTLSTSLYNSTSVLSTVNVTGNGTASANSARINITRTSGTWDTQGHQITILLRDAASGETTNASAWFWAYG